MKTFSLGLMSALFFTMPSAFALTEPALYSVVCTPEAEKLIKDSSIPHYIPFYHQGRSQEKGSFPYEAVLKIKIKSLSREVLPVEAKLNELHEQLKNKIQFVMTDLHETAVYANRPSLQDISAHLKPIFEGCNFEEAAVIDTSNSQARILVNSKAVNQMSNNEKADFMADVGFSYLSLLLMKHPFERPRKEQSLEPLHREMTRTVFDATLISKENPDFVISTTLNRFNEIQPKYEGLVSEWMHPLEP